MTYTSTGFTVVSLVFQSAPDSGGQPGAPVTWPNLGTGSVLPLTALTNGGITALRFQPWVRITATTLTGTGRIMVSAKGWRADGDGNVLGTGTNSEVQGMAADGATAVGNPVQAGGVDSTGNAQAFGVSATGGLLTQVGNISGADNISNGNNIFLPLTNGSAVQTFLATWQFIWDGTNVDRLSSAGIGNMPAATTLTARNSIGAALAEKGSRWTVVSTPATGSQATASIAAEAAVRHVADCVAFSGGSVAAPALTALTVNLRDGATGAGTVIWSYQVIVNAATGQNVAPFSVCGLNLTGTTNTAMTLEFSAALANLTQSVSVSGYNVN